MGNANSGIYVGDWGVSGDAASDATIGGTTAGAGNVISANGGYGVWITGDGATGQVVAGNKIGTDITGVLGLDNAGGVQVDNGAANNRFGGLTTRDGSLLGLRFRVGNFVGHLDPPIRSLPVHRASNPGGPRRSTASMWSWRIRSWHGRTARASQPGYALLDLKAG